jgi:integrase
MLGMDELISLKEASALLGVDFDTLKKRCQRGSEPGAVKHDGKWFIHTQRVTVLQSESGQYAQLHAEWIREMERGKGYKKPISPRGIESHVYGLDRFWLFIENPPKIIKNSYKKGEARPKPTRKANIPDITLENLELALSNVPINRKERKCHYSIREKMYNGFRGFFKFLVSKGLRTKADYVDLDKAKPHRIYEEARPYLTEDALFRVIAANDALTTGRIKDRRDHDAHLTKLLIYLSAFVGLRNEEMQDLHIGHINLKAQELSVIDGKGNKNRDVGFNTEVKEVISLWIKKYRTKSNHPNLIVSHTGEPMSKDSIYRRIRRAGKAAGVFINPHGLRRTCASVALENGIPLHHISENFGHTRTSTTEKSYVKVSKRQAMNSFKNFQPFRKPVEPKPETTNPADYW